MEFNRMSEMPVTGSPATRVEDVAPPMQDQVDSGMDEHLAEDVSTKERTNDEMVDLPVTGGRVEPVEISQTGVREWPEYDAVFHQDFLTRFGNTGYEYDYYQPAYRYGYDLATDPRYQGQEWSQVEPEARQQYKRKGLQAAWGDIKEAVRYAWDAVTGH
jgi:hypothetical protein